MNTGFSLLQLAMALIVVRWLVYSVYSTRRSGFELRPAGLLLAFCQGAVAVMLTSNSVARLLGYEPTTIFRLATASASLLIVPLLFFDGRRRWILRSREVVREPILQANTLLELGKLAPANGERAFEKAFDLYSQAATAAPRSFAAAYGCGYALYELAQLDSSETNVNQLDRAQYWFKKALALEPNEELRRFVAEIDEFRESFREA